MIAVTQRKNEIVRLTRIIERYPSTGTFKHDMMTYAYVLACGSIEFMVETILQEWLDKCIKHHENSGTYRGKKNIKYFLDIKSQASLGNIEDFHSTSLKKVRSLIGNIAGDTSVTKFDSLLNQVNQSVALQPDIIARLERINRFRHELAHGKKMPRETQPNVAELREDFLFVYTHIIKNIIKCLPRV